MGQRGEAGRRSRGFVCGSYMETDMNLSLTPNLEQFIRDRAASGDYNNASEVVREALRLFKRTEEQRALKLERLRSSVLAGDEAIAHGDFVDVNSDEALNALFADF